MKKLIILCILFAGCYPALRAQELTIEYNFGYGTFCMKELKDYLSDLTPEFNTGSGYEYTLKNVRITDNFPGHWIHQAKVGIEITKVHQVGLSLDFMNTAGQKAVSDYSGYYYLKFRTKGLRLGGFYRYTPPAWSTGVVRPYLMLTAGTVFNDGQVEEALEIYDLDKYGEDLSMDGVNFFVEPAIGCKVRLHESFALNLNAGYQFDLTKRFEYKGEKADIAPTWSGLRV
ncbi:MAG: hypothetical protein LBV74_16280 [Tannerella sp.]|jgi:hypothetical protein|nr:hypothetical protein [Tannerella sp.]